MNKGYFMAISKTNFLLIFKHNWTGFNIHKEFLKVAVDRVSTENLSEHDIACLKVSLSNMRESIENVEKYISEK